MGLSANLVGGNSAGQGGVHLRAGGGGLYTGMYRFTMVSGGYISPPAMGL